MKPHKCPVCGGAGSFVINQWFTPSTTGGCFQTKSCHPCSGTGIVWETELAEMGMDEYEKSLAEEDRL